MQDHRTMRMIEQPIPIRKILLSRENFHEFLRRIYHHCRAHPNPFNKLTVTREQFRGYYKFTVVRNPWSRAFSWYKDVMRDDVYRKNNKISGDLSFKYFLRAYAGRGMLRPQTSWLKGFNGSIKMDYIGRFETLSDDFREISSALHLPLIDLPHELKGAGEDYRQYYDKDTIKIISETYREEIKIFNYTFAG